MALIYNFKLTTEYTDREGSGFSGGIDEKGFYNLSIKTISSKRRACMFLFFFHN